MTLDSAVIFSLGAAFSYALADMGARYGLQHTRAMIGATLSRSASLFFLAAIALLAGAEFPPAGAHYIWIVAGGLMNPGLFSFFFMMGIARIGVARAAPIKGSSPLFATLIAVLMLGERPEWHQLAGVVLVVAGIALVSSGKTGGRWRRADAIWPIAAAMSSGLGASFWRMGLRSFPEPLAGAVVGMTAALAIVAAFALAFYRGELLEGARKAWKPFILCGMAAASGSYFFASALRAGEVFRVVSLIQTSPLLTVLLALLFLRQAEGITWRVPSGAALTVGGAILVNLRL